MTWLKLYDKLAKQPIRITRQNNVRVLINGEFKNLELKFDKKCVPYFELKNSNIQTQDASKKDYNLLFELDPTKVEEFLDKSKEKPSQLDKALERAAQHQKLWIK